MESGNSFQITPRRAYDPKGLPQWYLNALKNKEIIQTREILKHDIEHEVDFINEKFGYIKRDNKMVKKLWIFFYDLIIRTADGSITAWNWDYAYANQNELKKLIERNK